MGAAARSPRGRCGARAGLLVLALAATGALACRGGAPDSPEPTTLERVRRAGVIRVGYANEAPHAYLDPEAGRLTGEAPEIARVVLGDLGVGEVEGVLTEFGSLIPGLQAGRFDVIAAGMYVLPERCRQVAFSNPTYSVGEAFLVRAGNPLGLHSYADVAAHESARLGVVAGTVERGHAIAAGVPEERLVLLPDGPSAVAAVETGRVDAYGGTALTVQDLLDKADNGELERAAPFDDPVANGHPVRGYGAFAFRKADVALREAFDARLATFLGTPEHRALVRPFGFTEREAAGDVTAAELCAGP